MDKRTTRILLGCLACTLIVLFLFFVVMHFSQLSCELVHVEPQHLRSAQLNAFNKNKPIRSEDKTILMRISAFLEYDKPKSEPDEHDSAPASTGADKGAKQGNVWTSGVQPANNSQHRLAPSPSNPFGLLAGSASSAPSTWPEREHQSKERFLPLDLDSIETRQSSDPNRYKYILSFNCTKMHMIIVRSPDRVHVESIRMELKVSNRHKSECDVQLPATGAFSVSQQSSAGFGFLSSSSANQTEHSSSEQAGENGKRAPNKELVHYYCNKPLHYSCVHKDDKNNLLSKPAGQQQTVAGLHLAELHINAIEFETMVSPGGDYKLKHVHKEEFKSKRRECDVPVQ